MANISIVLSVLLVLVLAFCAIRFYCRYTSSSIGADDIHLIIALGCFLGYYIVAILGVKNGWGKHIDVLQTQQISALGRLELMGSNFYVCTTTFLKLSLAFTILRIQHHNVIWRRFLWILIVFIVILGVASFVWNFLQCQPLKALWDLSYPRERCHDTMYRDGIYATSVMFFIEDLVFAAMPIWFIRRLQLPLREKIGLCLLLGMGVTCAAAIIPKFIVLKDYSGTNGDFSYAVADTVLWSGVEISVGTISACIPASKKIFERALRKCGLLSSVSTSSRSRPIHYQQHGSVVYEHISIPEPTAGRPGYDSKATASGKRIRDVLWIDLDNSTQSLAGEG